MKFKNIEAFLAVAENLNFSKAAEQLGCSQSAVTMQIKELENELAPERAQFRRQVKRQKKMEENVVASW